MNVKEFLEKFNGMNHIKIYDMYGFQTHRYNDVRNAINDYGYYDVKGWRIENNVLVITIQTQF